MAGVYRNPTQPQQPHHAIAHIVPQLYVVSLAGSCTPTGTLTKTVARSLSGTQTAAGALTKAVSKAAGYLVGSQTGTGAASRSLVKIVSPLPAGTLTSSGALSARQVVKKVSGAQVGTGAIVGKAITHLGAAGRNLCPNPAAGTDVVGYTGIAGTVARATGLSGYDRTTGAVMTTTSTGTGYAETHYPPFVSAADLGGQTWTGSVQWSASAIPAGGLDVFLIFMDGGGALLGFPFATPAVTAGAVVRTTVSGIAPTGTKQVAMWIRGISVPIGWALTTSAARYAVTNDSSMTYFDGDSSGWGWDGASEDSSSSQLIGTSSGSMKPGGTLSPVRIVIKPVAGSQTGTGALTKRAVKNVSGTLTDSGSLPKTDIRRVAGSMTATGSMTPIRLPAAGSWTSAPIPLPTTPLAGTLVAWQATVPPSTTLIVETSVDNGVSWQIATNQGPIANLSLGVTVAGSVLIKVLMTRANYTIPTPSMTVLNVRVSSDDGVNEYCPLGVFLLDDVAVNDSAAGAYVEIAGSDLSRKIARNSWDTTYTVQPGTGYDDAIAAMVQDRMPGVEMNVSSTEQVTPQLQFGQSSSNDPWQDILQMAQSIGYEAFFDARGVFTLRAVPDPDIAPSQWEFEDIANPTITNLVRRVSDSDTYNKVIATGEGTGNTVPVQAIAIDDDPSSPTYYLGAYGTVTYRFTSPLILTPDQAQAAADAMLLQVKGATEAVEIDVIPMPAVEPGDVITVTRGRSKVGGRFLVDQITTPLDPGDTMHFTARRQRL